MTTYVGLINQLLKDKLANTKNVVSFGQNIAAGSCLSGLTRGLPVGEDSLVINSTNSEYSLTGAGFGMMAHGSNGIFFMKQLDFLLLGLDHMVHTWNSLRIRNLESSFTIFVIVVDNGYEGPQSCINTLPDFASISRIPTYAIASQDDARAVIDSQLVAPGVRLIGVSQRMYRMELSDDAPQGEMMDDRNFISKYGNGEDATLVSLNFAFPEVSKLAEDLKARNINTSLFNVAAASPTSWDPILKHAAQTGRVVICDDSKSQHKASTELAFQVLRQIPQCKVIIRSRTFEESWSIPNPDVFSLDTDSVIQELAIGS